MYVRKVSIAIKPFTFLILVEQENKEMIQWSMEVSISGLEGSHETISSLSRRFGSSEQVNYG